LRDVGIAIVGGLPERLPHGIANTVLFLDDSGAELARYRKTHLFSALDRTLFVPGDVLPAPVTFRGVQISLLICYDVEFPETVRTVALAGAEVILVPTAQMEPYEFLAEKLVRVRAWENRLYIAYINRSGAEGKLRYVGRTSIVGPSGEVLAARGGTHDEGIVIAVVDTEITASARQRNPYLSDRRPALYDPQLPPTN
jgi:5-aminopentanamidase